MARTKLNKLGLLAKLPRIEYEKSRDVHREEFEQMSFASTLLMLAEITPETEYVLCQDIAKHLVGQAYEPDDAALEEE